MTFFRPTYMFLFFQPKFLVSLLSLCLLKCTITDPRSLVIGPIQYFVGYWGDVSIGRPPPLTLWGPTLQSPPKSPPMSMVSECGLAASQLVYRDSRTVRRQFHHTLPQ